MERHSRLFVIIVSVMLLLVPAGAGAQRTVIGAPFFEAGAFFTQVPSLDGNPFPMGIGISAGQYGRIGFWKVMAAASDRSTAVSNADFRLPYTELYAHGAYMLRPLASRSRIFNVYIGPGTMVGAQFVDRRKDYESMEFTITRTKYDGEEHTQKSRTLISGDRFFVWGFSVCMDVEMFIAPSVALVLGASAGWEPMTYFNQFPLEAGLSLRFNL